MKKSISFILILAIVLSLLAPIGVLAEGGTKSQIVFTELKRTFGNYETNKDRLSIALNLLTSGLIDSTYDWTMDELGKNKPLKTYINAKLKLSDQNIEGLKDAFKDFLSEEDLNVLLDDLKKEKATDESLAIIGNMIGKIEGILSNEWDKDVLENGYNKLDLAKRVYKATVGNVVVKEVKKSGEIKLEFSIADNDLEAGVKNINTILKEDAKLDKSLDYITTAKNILTKVEEKLNEYVVTGTLNDIRSALKDAKVKSYIEYKEPETPSTGGGGGGGTTTPSTPKVPGEIHVPNDKTEPATSTIGKKEATVKTVEDIVNIKVKEKESVQAVEALRKKAGKDREATLLVRLDDVKGMNLNVELPEKLIAALLKEKVDLNIVTKDLEYVIPSDALADVKIPVGATIRLKTEEVAENVEVEEHQNAKKTIELYLEIVKGTEVTKVSKFKTSVVVKVNVQGLGDKDKLAVYFLNEENNELEFVTGKIVENKAILKLNHFSKYVIIESTKTFEDIDKHWAKLYIESMAAKEVVDGYDNGTFKPDVQVTRAEFAKMVLKGLEAEIVKYNGEFADVNANDWYADYLATMKKLGLIEGYGDGTFKPNEKISRAEMASILSNLVDVQVSKEEVAEILDKFIDKDNVPAWAAESIAKVVKAKIMVGKNGKFAPVDNSTRAESATTIYRIY